MALANLNTTDAYNATAQAGNEALSVLENELMKTTGESSMIDAVIKKLQVTIDQLQKEEASILAAFGAKDEADLQNKFRNFNTNTGLVNLTGANIRQAFLEEYQISIDKNMKEIQEYIDKFIVPNMINFIGTTGVKDIEKEMTQAFNAALKDLYITCDIGTGKVVVTRSGKAVSLDNNNMVRILASDLTKEQLKRISQLRDYAKVHGNPIIKGQTTVNGNTITSSFHSEWYDLTRIGGSTPLTETQIAKAVNDGIITTAQLNNINNKITDLICAQVSDQSLVRRYIQQMLKKDNYIFFVGKNVNGITGILGEIAAVISISELLVNVDASKIVDWVANHKIDNKKLSIDILLKGLGNIQVKNTAQDLSKIPLIDIGFAKGNVDYILEKLESGYNWNTDTLRSVIESESFNVPAKAKYKGGGLRATTINATFTKTEPKDWDTFVEAYNLMTDVISRLHVFLSGYAPDFLYMASPVNFKYQLAVLDRSMDGFIGQGVHIYLIGGVPHLASSQLKIIQEDLDRLKTVKDAEQHFTIKTVFGTIERDGEKIPYDYVAYKNKVRGKNAKIVSAMSFKL